MTGRQSARVAAQKGAQAESSTSDFADTLDDEVGSVQNALATVTSTIEGLNSTIENLTVHCGNSPQESKDSIHQDCNKSIQEAKDSIQQDVQADLLATALNTSALITLEP